ncbi:unnamed protein product, partial [Ectocarpus sp. 4 AP-2014]
ILSREYKYTAQISCGSSAIYNVKVVDSNGTVLTKNVTVNAPVCGEAFYVGPIEGESSTNNQNNFWVNAEGGSYGSFSYHWYIPNSTSGVTTPLQYDNNIYPQSSGMLTNTSGSPVTITLAVRVTDTESSYFIIRTRSVVIQPEFEIPSCFIAGTQIAMADGSNKNIEDVKVGDAILSYNIK